MSVHARTRPVTIHDVRGFKERGERFAMVTAYDTISAAIAAEAGIPLLLVGDSLGMVVLGMDSTVPVTVEQMLHHTTATVRGAGNAMVVADLPFGSYQEGPTQALRTATRFLKEAGANAVKLEGGGRMVEVTATLVEAGIPVMSHLGLTPQSVNALGGYRVQGRSDEQAARLLADAKALEQAGAFSLVLEAVPVAVGHDVTTALSIPTIGIGAGADTDGQVLVWHDMLGLTDGPAPRFVKRYADLRGTVRDALAEYARDVAEGAYPAEEHTYG
jgi:3-methyl-2-oxobutanoate hydroxymethyltransferase